MSTLGCYSYRGQDVHTTYWDEMLKTPFHHQSSTIIQQEV
jgi:hypothetical protein